MRQFIRYVLAVSALLSTICGANEAFVPKPADVRVVIDISGSMKKTDPTNLRKPAVDLLVRLLPDGSKAGIWTFGQSVNMLVPHRIVDPQWRAEGTQKANTISSVALYTNIGSALETAAADHAIPSKDFQRNIILLTDGVVDISKEAVENFVERKRILTELLPLLKESDYRIHTIALSADADQELMKKLSIATDGIFEVAETADELMNTFLRIFDQAVRAERVPLDENGFLVDSSIQEFTALIFRRAEVPASIIVAPDGKEYSATDSSNKVKWYSTDKYDLITVEQPLVGQWKVKTDMAPGSRVTVVSNLQLVVAPPKSNINVDQTIDLTYSFIANDETLTNSDFLNLLTGKVLINPANNKDPRIHPLTTVATNEGVFREELSGFDSAGTYDIKLLIDGKTFKREFVHRVNVNASAFRWEKRINQTDDKKTYVYTLIADLEMVDTSKTNVIAAVKNSLGTNSEHELQLIDQTRWEFSFAATEAAHYEIQMQVNGFQIDGSPLEELIQLDDFSYPEEKETLAVPVSPTGESESAPIETNPDGEGIENKWVYIAIGVANLLVLVLGFVAYRVIAGKDNRAELDEMEKTLTLSEEALKTKNNVPEPPVVIDIADEHSLNIPLNGDDGASLSMPDDLMADNLFPLDIMDDNEPKDKT